MNENIKNFIKELSEVYDSDSNDTYVSMYYSKGVDTKFFERRKKAVNLILKGDTLDNFNKTMIGIEKILKENSGETIAVFASEKYNFFKYITLPVKIEASLVVDSSPYLRPLSRMLDEWESFTLVLISTNSAKIYSVSLGEIEDTKQLSKDIMNKHKKGGCSQARFNRLRRGAIHVFLKDVVEELQKFADDQIVVAGPGTAKTHFIELLPKPIHDKIVDVIDIDMDDEHKAIKESIHLISEKEKRQSHEAVQHLKQEILRDGLAVYGPKETLQAVKNGQVELLIIEKDFKLHGWLCENCQAVGRGIKSKCPYCGNNTSNVDVLEEILEFAERTDAEIEFTDDSEIKDLDHVGGLLRYK